MGSLETSAVILSTGRTGTMFFADILRALAPTAEVTHEAGERSRLINIFMHAHLCGMAPGSLPVWAWKRVVGADLNACQKPCYIDSNNQIYAFVAAHPDYYPTLRVVHIVRDPRDYVRSHINWSRHRPKSYIANHLTPFWQPNAFLLGEMSLRQWAGLSRVERYGWIWEYKNRVIEGIQACGIPYLRVRFEDFFGGANPEAHLNQVLAFIGLPAVQQVPGKFSNPVNPGTRRSFPAWPSWSAETCTRLHQLCGERMHRYGYGDEADWLAKIGSLART